MSCLMLTNASATRYPKHVLVFRKTRYLDSHESIFHYLCVFIVEQEMSINFQGLYSKDKMRGRGENTDPGPATTGKTLQRAIKNNKAQIT